jgi:hypothetical protein
MDSAKARDLHLTEEQLSGRQLSRQAEPDHRTRTIFEKTDGSQLIDARGGILLPDVALDLLPVARKHFFSDFPLRTPRSLPIIYKRIGA